MDGISKAGLIGEQDAQHRNKAFSVSLSKKEEIALAEADLIRYFNPIYNKIYKKTFPKKSQTILDRCYNLDFSGLIVEINTDDLGMPIFSEAVRAGMHHIAKFDLHDAQTRRSFFSISTGEGRYALLDGSGPIW